MMKCKTLTLLLYGVLTISVSGQEIGLVLSGGGAKGLAHIGVIRALEENEIPIDYITGTSMGAIIGALYASGYTPDEMEDIIRTPEFFSWSTGIIPDKYYYYYKKRHKNASMITFEFLRGDSLIIPLLPTNIIPTHSMDLGLLELFARAGAFANNDFDNLLIPFRCVASDIHSNRAVILREGELPTAVRASMTYPFFFNPVEINGVLLFDGGIYNNFPFDVMKSEFSPDILIGSKVSSNVPPPTRDNIRLQIQNMITAQTDYDIEVHGGILIDIDVEGIALMDFSKAEEIIASGYETTIRNLDRIRAKTERRTTKPEIKRRRDEFKRNLPPLYFRNINVTGTSKYQIEYVINSIRQQEDYFTIDRLRSEYFKLVSDDKITEIYPRAVYNYSTGIFDLYLDLKSIDRFEVQVGGNISSTSINQGFAGIEYKFLGRNSYNLEGNVYFGRLYSSVMARGKLESSGALPVFADFSITLNRLDYFTGNNDPFFEDVRPSYLIQYDGNLKASIGAPAGVNGLLQVGYTVGRISDRYYQVDNFLKGDTTDRTNFDVNTLNIEYERRTLNRKQYATTGEFLQVNFQLIRGVEYYFPGSTSLDVSLENRDHFYLRLNSHYSKYFEINDFLNIGIYGDLVLSNKAFFSNYTATMLNTPSFYPTPHSRTLFLENYRSNSFGAIGVIPVFKINRQMHLQMNTFIFQPYERLTRDETNRPLYDRRFKHRSFTGSAVLVYHTPIGPASLSLNYYEKSGQKFYFIFNFGYIMFNKTSL